MNKSIKVVALIGDYLLPVQDRSKRLKNESRYVRDRDEWRGWEVSAEGPVVCFKKGDVLHEVPRAICCIEYDLTDSKGRK